jgi:hypothetical protein
MMRGTLQARPRPRSVGQKILARTLDVRRKTVRKVAIGSEPAGRGVIVLRARVLRTVDADVASSVECEQPPR